MFRSNGLRLGFLAFALYTAVYVVLFNRHTPFRGEHWVLIEHFFNGSSWWDSLRRVSTFVCFGDKRFQPLAFFPTMLSYFIFRTEFLGHYGLSLALHLGLTYFFLRLLHRIRMGSSRKGLDLFLTYPLEAGLFIVLFPFVDLLTWSFYHYVQWALLFSAASLAIYVDDEASQKQKMGGLALAACAALIYEPFLTYVFFYLVGNLYHRYQGKKNNPVLLWGPALFLIFLVPIYYYQFSTYLQKVASYDEDQRAMVITPIATKLLYVAHKTSLLIATSFWNLCTFATASKRNIYEFSLPSFLKPYGYENQTFLYVKQSVLVLITLFVLGAGAAAISLWRRRETIKQDSWVALLYLGCATGPFALIAWGRPVVRSISVSLQFRYFLVVALFLLLLSLEFCWRLLPTRFRRIYSVGLALLILINATNTFNQGYFLAYDMRDLAQFVAKSDKTGEALVRSVDEAFVTRAIPISDSENSLFEYNAEKCIASFHRRSGK